MVLIIQCQIAIAAKTPSATSTEKTPTTYTENKQNIMVTPDNAEFTLKLKSNPTTGYSWFLREYDANLVTPVKHSFQKPTDNKKIVGAPGFEIWTFKMKAAAFNVPQVTAIRLIYTQPWQSENSTQIVFRITTQGK